jgi:large subunit ribosomal protein L18
MANSKRDLFLKRRLRVRNKLRKVNAGRPRLSVHRSNKNISVQLIDDVAGVTLAAASTLEKDLGVVGKNNVEAAAKVGAAIAERAKKAGVTDCYFDRGGFPVPRQGEGAGRRGPRRRPEDLKDWVGGRGRARLDDPGGLPGSLRIGQPARAPP